MKRNILLFIIVCIPLFISTCKKEDDIKYPTSIIGTWKYIGLSTSKDVFPKFVFPDIAFMKITPDSILYYEGNLENITGKSKVIYIREDEICYEDTYFLDDGSKIVFKNWEVYEIKKDLLISKRINVWDSGWYGYYRAYPAID